MVIKKSVKKIILGLIFLLPLHIQSAVTLNHMFTDNMVLQRSMEVPVWGTANAGERVTVTFNGQDKSVTTGANGEWMIKFDTLTEGGPYNFVVKGNNTITLSNVMVGEVWLCSGQSNMRWFLNSTYDPAFEAVGVDDIRIINLWGDPWQEANPTTTAEFSGVCFFFGRKLYEELKVPIGLVKSAVNGSAVERWMSPATIVKTPGLDSGDVIIGAEAGDLYQSQLKSMIPYGIKGVAWYNGEANARVDRDPPDIRFLYAERLKLMIEGWRAEWNQGDFPFYSAQMADYVGTPYDLPVIREQLRLSLQTKNSGLAVLIGTGNNNVHPADKKSAGDRLAMWAFANDYGQTDLIYSGPLYESMEVVGNAIHLTFRHFGGGLKAAQGGLQYFEIAGSNSQYVNATAVINGDKVVISSPQITNPVMARYAWLNEPTDMSLTNNDGLPASPFKTSGDQLPDGIYGCRNNAYAGYDPNAFIHDFSECGNVAIINLSTEKLFPDIKINSTEINILSEGKHRVEVYDLHGIKLISWEGEDLKSYGLSKLRNGILVIKVFLKNRTLRVIYFKPLY